MARKKYYEPVKGEELLSADRKAALLTLAKEQVLDEQRKAAEKLFLDAEKEKIRNAVDPEQLDTEFFCDVPGYTKEIVIDGRVFAHDSVTTVSKAQSDTMREIQANAWRHERASGGAHTKEYTAPMRDGMVMGNGHVMNKLARM